MERKLTTIIDIENSITRKKFLSKTSNKETDYIDNSPYSPNNKLVSVGYKCSDGDTDYLFFHHVQWKGNSEESRKKLQAVLDKTDLLVGHNIKYDLQWLLECGFEYSGRVFDTMIFEYIIAKAGNVSLKLVDCCKKYKIIMENKDILGEHLDAGGNTDDLDIELLTLYGKGDIEATYKLFAKQVAVYKAIDEIKQMAPIINASNAFTLVLIDMERNGFKIDLDTLAKVEDSYRTRLKQIEPRLHEIVSEVMGHTPYNIDSPEQLSQIVFGVKITDKEEWSKFFNIGIETNGPRRGKAKYKTPRNHREVVTQLRKCSRSLQRTTASQCESCIGRGYIRKIKKDGKEYKKTNKCKSCLGTGIIYVNTLIPAGLGVEPLSYEWTTNGGFAVSKKSILPMLHNPDLSPLAKEFLTLLAEYSSITVYLTAFIEGIQKKLTPDGLLHMQYNQCITKTGRLSSSFHNLPRGNTFPVKKAIVSRWKGGKILNIDAAQLEFRVGTLLSGDTLAAQDIIDKVDVHQQTADVMTSMGQPTDRQTGKIFTFAPFYGRVKGNEIEKAYYKWFLEKYKDVRVWQNKLADDAVNKRQISSPSGRIYRFPHVRRFPNGGVSQSTQIYNYTIQGFSFDLVMVAMIEIHKAMKKAKLKSKVITNIHDSVVIDCFPNEVNKVIATIKPVLDNMKEIIIKWFPNANNNVPILWDYSSGEDWYNQSKI